MIRDRDMRIPRIVARDCDILTHASLLPRTRPKARKHCPHRQVESLCVQAESMGLEL
jgi:hypothetical protein